MWHRTGSCRHDGSVHASRPVVPRSGQFSDRAVQGHRTIVKSAGIPTRHELDGQAAVASPNVACAPRRTGGGLSSNEPGLGIRASARRRPPLRQTSARTTGTILSDAQLSFTMDQPTQRTHRPALSLTGALWWLTVLCPTLGAELSWQAALAQMPLASPTSSLSR